jgi:hypothetical protein
VPPALFFRFGSLAHPHQFVVIRLLRVACLGCGRTNVVLGPR